KGKGKRAPPSFGLRHPHRAADRGRTLIARDVARLLRATKVGCSHTTDEEAFNARQTARDQEMPSSPKVATPSCSANRRPGLISPAIPARIRAPRQPASSPKAVRRDLPFIPRNQRSMAARAHADWQLSATVRAHGRSRSSSYPLPLGWTSGTTMNRPRWVLLYIKYPEILRPKNPEGSIRYSSPKSLLGSVLRAYFA